MPVEAKPLFRPDVLRPHVDAFTLPPHVEHFCPKLEHWAELIRTERINNFRESEILPSFLHDFFKTLLCYVGLQVAVHASQSWLNVTSTVPTSSAIIRSFS